MLVRSAGSVVRCARSAAVPAQQLRQRRASAQPHTANVDGPRRGHGPGGTPRRSTHRSIVPGGRAFVADEPPIDRPCPLASVVGPQWDPLVINQRGRVSPQRAQPGPGPLMKRTGPGSRCSLEGNFWTGSPTRLRFDRNGRTTRRRGDITSGTRSSPKTRTTKPQTDASRRGVARDMPTLVDISAIAEHLDVS